MRTVGGRDTIELDLALRDVRFSEPVVHHPALLRLHGRFIAAAAVLFHLAIAVAMGLNDSLWSLGASLFYVSHAVPWA